MIGCLVDQLGSTLKQDTSTSRLSAQDVSDEPQLIKAVLRGDKQSYEVLVRRYQKLVYNVLYQMVRSHETACDLTQETFIKALRGLPGFQLNRSFKPWLLRIATNACLNAIRDTKEHESLEAILEENPHAEPADKSDVEMEAEWRLSQQQLNDALATLPVRHREIFVLRYQHDLSYEEISEVTGETLSAVKSQLFRIRERLRVILKESMNA